MKPAYKYSYGNVAKLFKNPAEIAGPICQQLSETIGLTPENLLDVSRDESAPLHNESEWDDEIAGEKFRKEQAKSIIRHLIIVRVEADEEKKKPAYKDRSFVYTGEKDNAYVPLKAALNNEVWKQNLLTSALRDMELFIAKYRRLNELAGVIADMTKYIEDSKNKIA